MNGLARCPSVTAPNPSLRCPDFPEAQLEECLASARLGYIPIIQALKNQREEEDQKFNLHVELEASLGYKSSWRPAWATSHPKE